MSLLAFRRRVQPASLPPGLPGLQPHWSRLVTAIDAAGIERTWHVLDSAAAVDGADPADGANQAAAEVHDPAAPTLLCVHGNPTWSYLWRALVAAPPPGCRVIAVDQLGMGYSERTAAPRRLAERITDLGVLTQALGITGPVVPVAHDWGGAIALGWALNHRSQLAGLILTNTAVHQPAGSPAPALIRLARTPGVRQLICQWTPLFVGVTSALTRRPAITAEVRRALAAPYVGRDRRAAVADFVADIPLDDGHPSAAALAGIITDLPELRPVPSLLLWGPRDPVFSDRYLRDLLGRLPDSDVHRYENASHLVTESMPDFAGVVAQWLERRVVVPGTDADADTHTHTDARPDAGAGARADADGPVPAEAGPPVLGQPGLPLNARLKERAGDSRPAVITMNPGRGAASTIVSFAELNTRVRDLAAGLTAIGVRPGDRVSLLIRPGADLTAAVYACWRAGAVVVLADAGLGLRGLRRALRGAGPDYVIGIPRGLLAARLLNVPGRRIMAATLPGSFAVLGKTVLGANLDVAGIGQLGAAAELPAEPDPESDCAIVFTSGATGPAKGVRYRHRQLAAQLESLRQTYDIGPDDRFVAAFAPFALYGPALGIASAVPDMDVTAPATLTAAALADAIAAIDATVVFASPAALANVAVTVGALSVEQRAALRRPRLLLSAGAPVSLSLQRTLALLMPNASVHTPYGMTEALPITDIELKNLEDIASGEGVCVGRPVTGVQVLISGLDEAGSATGSLSDRVGVTGEVCVRARHVKDTYDRLWATEAASSRTAGWHRTGDVGHLDAEGNLWIEGRLVHVLSTAAGIVSPVPAEQRIEQLAQVRSAALVGVGPSGTQQPVAVVSMTGVTASGRSKSLTLADPGLAAAVRAASKLPLCAVLVMNQMPVDIRHNSKIDRTLLAKHATRLLSGRR